LPNSSQRWPNLAVSSIPGYHGLTRERAGAVTPEQGNKGAATPASDRDTFAQLAVQLRDLASQLRAATPDYQYSEPLSFGGVTTTQANPWRLTSPYQTPCQYSVTTVTFTDAGICFVGQDQGLLVPTNTQNLDPSARTRAQVYASAGQATIPLTDYWLDLPADGAVCLACSVNASHAVYVSLVFRRAVSHAGVYPEGYSA
jgi:hypothetical protein